ncbi:MAG: RNA methyltransferase, partial [Bacteroidota bacterium]
GNFVNNNQALAVMDFFNYPWEEIREGEYIIALDNIQDPGNLGSILRIADWYGISQLICSQNTVDLYNPKVISASMGSFLRIQVHYLDLYAFLREPTNPPAYAAVLGAKNLHQLNFSPKGGILIMGNESKGIGEALKKLPLEKISIPSFGQAESLNVAMATAVICDNLRRQIPPS